MINLQSYNEVLDFLEFFFKNIFFILVASRV